MAAGYALRAALAVSPARSRQVGLNELNSTVARMNNSVCDARRGLSLGQNVEVPIADSQGLGLPGADFANDFS
jgi:hypothetical protein